MPAPILPALAAMLGRTGAATAGRAAAGVGARGAAGAGARAGTASRSGQLLGRGQAFGDVLSGAQSLSSLEKETSAREEATAASEQQSQRTRGLVRTLATLNLGALGLTLLFKRLSASMAESNLRFAEFGGQLGQAAGERRAREVQRNIASSAARGSSGLQALRAQNDLKDALRPLNDGFANIANVVSTFIANRLTEGVELLKQLPIIKGIVENAEEEAKKRGLPFGQFIDDIAAGKTPEEIGKRKPRALPPGGKKEAEFNGPDFQAGARRIGAPLGR